MLLGALCEALSELEEGAGPWPGSPLVTGEGACRGEVAHPPYVPASGRAGPPTRGTDSKPVSLLRPRHSVRTCGLGPHGVPGPGEHQQARPRPGEPPVLIDTSLSHPVSPLHVAGA